MRRGAPRVAAAYRADMDVLPYCAVRLPTGAFIFRASLLGGTGLVCGMDAISGVDYAAAPQRSALRHSARTPASPLPTTSPLAQACVWTMRA